MSPAHRRVERGAVLQISTDDPRAEVREGTYDVLALRIQMTYPRLSGVVPAPGDLAVEYVMVLEQQTP